MVDMLQDKRKGHEEEFAQNRRKNFGYRTKAAHKLALWAGKELGKEDPNHDDYTVSKYHKYAVGIVTKEAFKEGEGVNQVVQDFADSKHTTITEEDIRKKHKMFYAMMMND